MSAPLRLDPAMLGLLMPMYVALDAEGAIRGAGPTLVRLMKGPLDGRGFFDLFEIRRPSGIADPADLARRVGQRLFLAARDLPATPFRGAVVPLEGGGVVLNLSFGIGIVDAVRDHGLTHADFAPTDLAMELLYLVEAKSAIMEELRALNLRLQGAKSVAEEQALTDTLTGLRNRRGFEAALAGAIGGGLAFGLLHLDLDFFKAVNDTYGHAAGDHVLRTVGAVLAAETRAGDTVARVGGDEFVVLLRGVADPARVEQIARRIIARVQEPIPYEGGACRVAASIGATLSGFYPDPGGEEMLQDADRALYAAKHAGRSCLRLHRPPPASGIPPP